MIVRFSPAAKGDIQSIYDYIANADGAAAARVVAAIESATDRLALFPLMGRVGSVASTRELVVPRLPYIVVYRIADDELQIIADFHAAQDLPRGGS